mgnify:CR=1 FL=1
MVAEATSRNDSPLQLGFNLDFTQLAEFEDVSSSASKDLEKIVELAKHEEELAKENLRQRKEETLSSTPNEDVARITSRLRDLRAELEQQTAMQRDLTTKRDVAWEAYKVLTQKQTEILSAARAADSIAFVSQAVIPLHPENRGALKTVAMFGMIGFLLSVLGIIIIKWWKDLDLFSKEPSQIT